MADLDVDEILAKQVEQLEKEKKELLERLKGQEKKVWQDKNANISHFIFLNFTFHTLLRVIAYFSFLLKCLISCTAGNLICLHFALNKIVVVGVYDLPSN